MTASSPPSALSARLDRFGPWVLGALMLLPLLVWQARIREFFWFGDDFDLVSQISEVGLGTWILKPWAESWSPVFKAVWGGSVIAFRGSYFAMLALIWVNSAITVGILSAVLRRCGFGWSGLFPALAVIGMCASNIETLCWSVQLSPAMANTFMAAALWLHLSRVEPQAGWSWSGPGAVIACVAASALCYSRGVLSGAVLAALALLPPEGWPRRESWARRLGLAAAYLAPAVVVTVVIMLATKGNQNQLLAGDVSRFLQMFWFGFWYLSLNPFYRLLDLETWGPYTVIVLGLGKLLLVTGALYLSRGPQRRLLVLVLLFDLGNAVLLGLGRYHTGLGAAVGSRYQYCALIAVMPFVAFWVERAFAQLGTDWRRPALGCGAVTLALVIWLVRGWTPQLDAFVDWRGTRPRSFLLSGAPLPPDFTTPGIPFLSTQRARELIARYHLH